MIHILIKIGYLLGTIIIGLALYYWSATFKKISELSPKEINKDEEDHLDESESTVVNRIGTAMFILTGFFIWAHMGTTIGKIAADISNHAILKWIYYFFMYFIFLRFPFGFGNKMIKRRYDFKRFSEKIIFSITMIVFYISAICCFDMIPKIFKWHLIYL